MNVSSLSLDDNSMDVVMEKGTLDSLQEKSRDTAGCSCYLASPCNKPDFDHVPYVNQMIPLELFYRDVLGACLCIGSAYSFGETQVFILTIRHGRIIFNSLRPNVESKHGDWKGTKKEWSHKNCLLVMMIWNHKWKWIRIVFSTWTGNRLCDCAASIILCNSVVQTFVRSFVFPNCVLRPADRLL